MSLACESCGADDVPIDLNVKATPPEYLCRKCIRKAKCPIDQVIAPYDRRLGNKRERMAWGARIASSLAFKHRKSEPVTILAGLDYVVPVRTAALRVPIGKRNIESRAKARAKCAEILNTRTEPLTAATITFDQICKLRDDLAADVGAAQIATGYYESGTPVMDPDRQQRARERCAKILHARAVSK